jgi:hypothetical protein
MIFKLAILVVSLFSLVLGDPVTLKSCGGVSSDASSKIEYIDISGCTSTGCTFKKGTDVTMNFKFKTGLKSVLFDLIKYFNSVFLNSFLNFVFKASI